MRAPAVAGVALGLLPTRPPTAHAGSRSDWPQTMAASHANRSPCAHRPGAGGALAGRTRCRWSAPRHTADAPTHTRVRNGLRCISERGKACPPATNPDDLGEEQRQSQTRELRRENAQMKRERERERERHGWADIGRGADTEDTCMTGGSQCANNKRDISTADGPVHGDNAMDGRQRMHGTHRE